MTDYGKIVLERRSPAGTLLEVHTASVTRVQSGRITIRWGLGLPPEFALHTGLPCGRGAKQNPWRVTRESLETLRELVRMRGAS